MIGLFTLCHIPGGFVFLDFAVYDTVFQTRQFVYIRKNPNGSFFFFFHPTKIIGYRFQVYPKVFVLCIDDVLTSDTTYSGFLKYAYRLLRLVLSPPVSINVYKALHCACGTGADDPSFLIPLCR